MTTRAATPQLVCLLCLLCLMCLLPGGCFGQRNKSITVMNEGVKFTQDKLYDSAERRFKQALETDPGNYLAWANLGAMYKDQKKWQECANAFEAKRAEIIACDKNDEVRTIDGTVILSGVWLPADAVLDSSVTAMRSLIGGREHTNGQNGNGHAMVRGRAVLSLFVRVPGRAAGAASRR